MALVKSNFSKLLSCYVTRTTPIITKRFNSNTGQEIPSTHHYDIIIAGGGMVGCTLACLLAKNPLLANFKVLLLEGSPKKTFELKQQYSNRVSSLNMNTKSIMSKLGVWKHIEEMRLQPVKNMQVWDACSEAFITFDQDNLQSDVAYIVENDVLLHAVNKELEKPDNPTKVDVVHSAKISKYDLMVNNHNSDTKVHMENGAVLTCNLLVGADGVNSQVRREMGVQYLSWSYEQMGIVATLRLSEPTDNRTAWQRFLPTGPVALLPLDDEHSSLVWSTTVPEAKKLLDLSEEQFIDALNDALWKQYPRSQLVQAAWDLVGKPCTSGWSRQLPPSLRAASSRAAFPLGFGHSVQYVAAGVALVGDAAHRVHPLAGQGVNLGYGDVNELVDQLSQHVYMGARLDDISWLREYETRRLRHNVPTQLAIEALHRLYSVDFPPVVLARSLGLQITNALSPVKRAIMSHATA